MAANYATSFDPVNYSGMLFNKGNAETPLSSIIGARQKTTDHVEFVTGQEYTTAGGTQPAISEEASLVAPSFTPIGRTQKTNVTQIFHETVGISYGKKSNMGTLNGVNVANQAANPMSELDFQTAAKMTKIARDIEFTFINGVYSKATSDSTVNKTRGLIPAITSNLTAKAGTSLGYWDIVDMVKKIKSSNAPVGGLVLWCTAIQLLQINADALLNNMTVMPSSRTVNGINITELVTPFGNVGLFAGQFVPEDTALMLNLGVLSPVHQPVPGKGNFFLELLSQAGAGERYQIFGQLGLDHGPEWYHGKFTGIDPTFSAPSIP